MNLITERLRLVPCSVEMLKSLIDKAIDLTKLTGAVLVVSGVYLTNTPPTEITRNE